MAKRVLVIAGSDCSGGAGIQADIKTITMLGGYAATAITALTAQNTLGVHNVHDVPPPFIQEQIKATLDDVGADAIKIGMLANAPIIHAVADAISAAVASGAALVLDPVMVAKGGAPLLAQDAVRTLIERLVPMATIITPNIHEASALCGHAAASETERRQAAEKLKAMGANNILITGGDVKGEQLYDLLLDEAGDFHRFAHPRINTPHTHGTGCTLASAIATGLAGRMPLANAVREARDFVQRAIAAAPKLGAGHGPLGHASVR